MLRSKRIVLWCYLMRTFAKKFSVWRGGKKARAPSTLKTSTLGPTGDADLLQRRGFIPASPRYVRGTVNPENWGNIQAVSRGKEKCNSGKVKPPGRSGFNPQPIAFPATAPSWYLFSHAILNKAFVKRGRAHKGPLLFSGSDIHASLLFHF